MVRYLFVASAALMADLVAFVTLTQVLHVHYIGAAIIGFLAGITVNYLLSVRWVFTTSTFASRRLEFMAFLCVGAVGLLLTVCLMWLITETFKVSPLVSKGVVTCAVFFWNFLARKFWVFNGKEAARQEQSPKVETVSDTQG